MAQNIHFLALSWLFPQFIMTHFHVKSFNDAQLKYMTVEEAKIQFWQSETGQGLVSFEGC